MTNWYFWLKGTSQYPAYFVGSEIFGAIYFGSGKDKVFEVMKKPSSLMKAYNEAVLSNPNILGKCPLLEKDLLDQAFKGD